MELAAHAVAVLDGADRRRLAHDERHLDVHPATDLGGPEHRVVERILLANVVHDRSE
jgi:hypothetical protein